MVDEEVAAGTAPSPAPSAAPSTGGTDELAAGGGRFRRTETGLEWACARCGSWNSLEVSGCVVCGAPLGARDEEPAPRDLSPVTGLVATALLPGLAHVLAGRIGTGVARALLWLLWLAGGIALVVSARGSDGSVLPGLVLLLGAVAVWVGSLLDTQVLVAGGRRELLDARALLWLVVGVIGLITVAFLLTAMRLSG
jgi:hypothetical protein